MIAVLVVVVLFVKVLEQFGLLEASYDGKQKSGKDSLVLLMWLYSRRKWLIFYSSFRSIDLLVVRNHNWSKWSI